LEIEAAGLFETLTAASHTAQCDDGEVYDPDFNFTLSRAVISDFEVSRGFIKHGPSAQLRRWVDLSEKM
jgi:hypothetical protein